MTAVRKFINAAISIIVLAFVALLIWSKLGSGKMVSRLDDLTFDNFGPDPVSDVLLTFDPDGKWDSDPEKYKDYRDEGFAMITFTGTCGVIDSNGYARQADFALDISVTPNGEDNDYFQVSDVSIDGWVYDGSSILMPNIIDVVYGNSASTDIVIESDANWLGIDTFTFTQKDMVGNLTSGTSYDRGDSYYEPSEPSDGYIIDHEDPYYEPSEPSDDYIDSQLENTPALAIADSTWFATADSGLMCGIYIYDFITDAELDADIILYYPDEEPDDFRRFDAVITSGGNPYDLVINDVNGDLLMNISTTENFDGTTTFVYSSDDEMSQFDGVPFYHAG